MLGPQRTSSQPRALIVAVNHAVGLALVHRLAADGQVTLAAVSDALDVLALPAPACDVLILCPYLAPAELQALRAAAAAAAVAPAVVQLHDAHDEAGPAYSAAPGAVVAVSDLDGLLAGLAPAEAR